MSRKGHPMSEYSYETLLVETNDGVTRVTLNRPEKRNAMSPQLHMEMSDVLDKLAFDDATRVLVVTGAGDSFCAGMDLQKVFYDLHGNPEMSARVRKAAQWRSHQLRLFPKPTIAEVNGWCFGGAFTIVASCDIAIGAHEAVFGLSEVNFGKIAGGWVSKSISECLNPRDALYYLLTGDTFDGHEADKIRFLTRAVPRSELRAAVDAVAAKLKAKNPTVVSAAKEAYKHVESMSYEQAGAWLNAMSLALDHRSGTAWKTGVEKFKGGEFKPGLGSIDTSVGEAAEESVSS